MEGLNATSYLIPYEIRFYWNVPVHLMLVSDAAYHEGKTAAWKEIYGCCVLWHWILQSIGRADEVLELSKETLFQCCL